MSHHEHQDSQLAPSFDPTSASREALKREFARRLKSARADKGWTQSELARRADAMGPARVARDDISVYERASSLPGVAKLRQIARALDMDTNDLIPGSALPSADKALPEFDVRASGKNMVWMRMSKQMSLDKAVRIMTVLKEPDA